MLKPIPSMDRPSPSATLGFRLATMPAWSISNDILNYVPIHACFYQVHKA